MCGRAINILPLRGCFSDRLQKRGVNEMAQELKRPPCLRRSGERNPSPLSRSGLLPLYRLAQPSAPRAVLS